MSGRCMKRTKRFFGAITIEPVYLLFTLSHGLYTLVAQELYIMKARRKIEYVVAMVGDAYSIT